MTHGNRVLRLVPTVVQVMRTRIRVLQKIVVKSLGYKRWVGGRAAPQRRPECIPSLCVEKLKL